MLHVLRRSFPVLALFVLAGMATPAQAQQPQPNDPRRFPHLYAAWVELREARQELTDARGNMGGHRDAALRAVNDAIASLALLMQIRDDGRGEKVRAFDRDQDYYQQRYKDFPRVRQALHDLREARDELRQSWEVHGPLRERALRDVSAAIEQVHTALKASGPVRGGDVKYPCMHFALYELREARKELAAARDDFGPRKETALRAIDDATNSLKTILQVKGDNVQGFDRDPDFYKPYRNYPRLRQTLHDLREARDELRECGVDFRGLKDRALRDISVAIDQIQAMVPNQPERR